MNVYQQTLTEDFKSKLPIKWDYWANKDLSKIPKKFHIVFTTDWNWGLHSTMDKELRTMINDLFLEYNKFEILNS
jgi:hypothetical protein